MFPDPHCPWPCLILNLAIVFHTLDWKIGNQIPVPALSRLAAQVCWLIRGSSLFSLSPYWIFLFYSLFRGEGATLGGRGPSCFNSFPSLSSPCFIFIYHFRDVTLLCHFLMSTICWHFVKPFPEVNLLILCFLIVMCHLSRDKLCEHRAFSDSSVSLKPSRVRLQTHRSFNKMWFNELNEQKRLYDHEDRMSSPSTPLLLLPFSPTAFTESERPEQWFSIRVPLLPQGILCNVWGKFRLSHWGMWLASSG